MRDSFAPAAKSLRHHEVLILISGGGGEGRCFGSQPRPKVSMTIMRPPQHGRARRRQRGCATARDRSDGEWALASREAAKRGATNLIPIQAIKYCTAHDPFLVVLRQKIWRLREIGNSLTVGGLGECDGQIGPQKHRRGPNA